MHIRHIYNTSKFGQKECRQGTKTKGPIKYDFNFLTLNGSTLLDSFFLVYPTVKFTISDKSSYIGILYAETVCCNISTETLLMPTKN